MRVDRREHAKQERRRPSTQAGDVWTCSLRNTIDRSPKTTLAGSRAPTPAFVFTERRGGFMRTCVHFPDVIFSHPVHFCPSPAKSSHSDSSSASSSSVFFSSFSVVCHFRTLVGGCCYHFPFYLCHNRNSFILCNQIYAEGGLRHSCALVSPVFSTATLLSLTGLLAGRPP